MTEHSNPEKIVRNYVLRSCRIAQIEPRGPHTLRHTFCSHLAMKGVPVVSIQELAGHKDQSTTMRYMHLSPKVIDDAIRLLEEPMPQTQHSSNFKGTYFEELRGIGEDEIEATDGKESTG